MSPPLTARHRHTLPFGAALMNDGRTRFRLNFDDIASLLRPNQRSYFENIFLQLDRKISIHEFAVILRASERATPLSQLIEVLSREYISAARSQDIYT